MADEEWLDSLLQILDLKKNLKIGFCVLDKSYIVSILLGNAMTCLYGIPNVWMLVNKESYSSVKRLCHDEKRRAPRVCSPWKNFQNNTNCIGQECISLSAQSMISRYAFLEGSDNKMCSIYNLHTSAHFHQVQMNSFDIKVLQAHT